MAYEMAGECQVCGKVHKVALNGLVARHKADVEWLDPQEYCRGGGAPPYEIACNLLADYMAHVLQEAAVLALDHLNTAVMENVDKHGRSWCRVTVVGNAFNPRGGVQWVHGRVMQTGPELVQCLDGTGRLHPLPGYKTVRAARKGMLELRLEALDDWHQAATQRAEWLKLRLEQWAPRKLKRWTTPRTAARHTHHSAAA